MADIATILSDIGGLLNDLARVYGLPGVFAASLLGSIIPFLPVPYLIIVVLLSGQIDPLSLGIAAGIGGAIGKSTSYILGRSGYLVAKPGTQQNLSFLGRFVRKYGDLGVFIFAVTPLPDDIYMIPMGMVRFPFWRFMLANTAGKIILSVAVAYFGRAYLGFSSLFLGEGSFLTIVVLIVGTIVLTVLLARADWETAYNEYKQGGIAAVLKASLRIVRVTKREDKPA